MTAPEVSGVTYAVWLADLADTLDKARLPDGSPLVPGDYVVWRMPDNLPAVPIGAYANEADAHNLADGLNYDQGGTHV